MARKTAQPKRPRRSASPETDAAPAPNGGNGGTGAAPDPIDAALELAATQGWRRTTLADVATAAGLTLSELYGRYPSKAALLAGFRQRLDEAMLAADVADEEPRDRLFEVIMRRLDVMTPHKAAIRTILREAPCDPATMADWPILSPGRTLGWMLEAARIEVTGLAQLLWLKGLALVYADVVRVWLGDDSPDAARTMAALDRRLRQAESLVQAFPFGRRRSAPA